MNGTLAGIDVELPGNWLAQSKLVGGPLLRTKGGKVAWVFTFLDPTTKDDPLGPCGWGIRNSKGRPMVGYFRLVPGKPAQLIQSGKVQLPSPKKEV